jgi:hypothetical protein
VFRADVPPRRHTRRQALAVGAGALALAGVRPQRAAAEPAHPRGGLPAAGPDLFELAVGDEDGAAGWRTTDVLAAPRRFDLAGVRWARGDGVEVQLRARPRGGPWTRWVELPSAQHHGPDAGGARTGTEPAWTGPADEVQLRLRGQARGLRVRFVHGEPAAARAAARARSLSAAKVRRAQAPRVITRAEWGGDAVPPRAAPSFGQVQLAFVHHTVTANTYAPEQSAGIVLAIARYHRDTNRWNDVGYNFLVDQYGQVFEGRAGGIDQAVVGAQAQGWNSLSTGIACLGTFTAVAQAEAGLEALAQLIAWKLGVHGVPVEGQVTLTSLGGESNRWRSGTPVVFERISGHRDGNATSCPGELLYGQLADLRARAARYAASAPAPAPPAPAAALSMWASTSTVRGIAPITLTGVLQFNDGAPLEGAPVDVYHAAGAATQRLGGAACAADGTWSATVTLPQAGIVYARYPGDGAHPTTDSPPTQVTILPRLALALSAARIRPGRRVRVRATVTPAAAAARAELLVEHRDRGRWRAVRRRRVAIRAGRVDLHVRLRRPGRYRLTLAVPGASVARAVRAVSS